MAVIEWIQNLLGSQLQPLFLAITHLGSESAYIVMLTLYYWLIDPWDGRQLGLIFSFSYGLNVFLKEWFASPRPFLIEPNLASSAAQASAEGYAFPSGHTQGAASFWFWLAWQHQRRWLWILSITMVVLIALSRLYLGVHYPIDVIAGIVLGMLLAWLGSRYFLTHQPQLWLRIGAIFATSLLVIILPHLARPLGVCLAFFLTTPHFQPPTTWKSKWLFGGIGVVLVLIVHKGSGWLLDSASDLPLVVCGRYAFTTLFGTVIYPQIAKKVGMVSNK